MKNFNIGKLFYNKKFLVAFSIIIAVGMWIRIYMNENPTRETILSNVPVGISLEGSTAADLGLGIVGSIDKDVSVTVSGPNYIVSALSPNDIQVTASISNVNAAGEYELELLATRNGAKTGYTIVGVNPSSVKVMFDFFETKTFNVEPVAIGASATEGSGLEAKSAQITNNTQSTLEITGPRSVVEKINKVQAISEVNAVLDKTTSYEAQLKFLDADGNAVDSTHLTYPMEPISITVPIYKGATLPILPVFVNVPAGYTNGVPYSLSETTINVEGAPEIIDSLSEIKLKEIDFSSVKSSAVSFEATLDLPSAVKSTDNLETVTVELSLGQLTERTFNVSNITGTSLQTGLKATFSSLKNVKMCGVSKEIKSVNSTHLSAVADLSNITAPGSYTVPVVIKCESNGFVWAIGSYEVKVTIE